MGRLTHQIRFKRFWAAMLVCMAICGGVLGTAYAQSAQVSRSIEIRTIGIPPYGIEDDVAPSGVYYDIANRVAVGAGYQAHNYIYPYARIVNELKSGSCDMTIMFRYPELEDHVTYIAPLPSLRTAVIGIEGSSYGSIADLRGKTIAYLRGAAFSNAVDADSGIFSQATDDFDQGMRMLKFGRVDAIIGPLAPIQRAAQNAGIKLGTPLIVAERTPWIQISNKSLDRISADQLMQVFGDITKSGELAMIRQKYQAAND